MTQQCDLNQSPFPMSRGPSQPSAPAKALCREESHREGCSIFYLHFPLHLERALECSRSFLEVRQEA